MNTMNKTFRIMKNEYATRFMISKIVNMKKT